jgi:sugar (pentulose or hexulose) kinase
LRLDESLLVGNHGCGLHVVPQQFLSLAYVITSGAALRWYRDTLGVPDRDQAAAAGQDAYEVMIAAAPDRPARVFVLPYLAGTGTPWLDHHQRGAVFGLALDTSRSEIVKGILDGLSFEFRINLDSLAASGFPVKLLKAMGGGARSPRWMQLIATITGVPVETVECPEAGCLGAAFLAGQAMGVFGAADEVTGLVCPNRVYYPEASRRREYDAVFGLYQELRQRVAGLRLAA